MGSNYRNGTVAEALQLRYSTEQAVSGLFVQCKIYDINDTVLYTTNLTESITQPGRYIGNVTITTEGDYEAFYVAYSDAGHTTESDFAPRLSEALRITLTAAKFGGVSLPPTGVGIMDNDIAAIIEGVRKAVGAEQINPWEYSLSNGRTVAEELMAKSEFNYKKDVVKLPELKINFSDIQKEIKRGFESINSTLPQLRQDVSSLSAKFDSIKNFKLNDLVGKIDETISTLKAGAQSYTGVVKAGQRVESLLQELGNVLTKLDLLSQKTTTPLSSVKQSLDTLPGKISAMLSGVEGTLTKEVSKVSKLIYTHDGVGVERYKQNKQEIERMMDAAVLKMRATVSSLRDRIERQLDNLEID